MPLEAACEAWVRGNWLIIVGAYLCVIFALLATQRLVRARRRCQYATAMTWFVAAELGMGLASYASYVLGPSIQTCGGTL